MRSTVPYRTVRADVTSQRTFSFMRQRGKKTEVGRKLDRRSATSILLRKLLTLTRVVVLLAGAGAALVNTR